MCVNACMCVCITKVEEEVMNLRRGSTGSVVRRKGRDGNDETTILMYGILKYIFQANTQSNKTRTGDTGQ